MKPIYALHKNHAGEVLNAGSFEYSFKLNEVERFLNRFNGVAGRVVSGSAEKEPPPSGHSGELRALGKAIQELREVVSGLDVIG